MKIQILDINGKKIKEMNTELFEEPIREDIIFKIIEAEKTRQPYSPSLYAGMKCSASGKIRHKRHAWKGGYGRGMSRIPRKIMWRRGTQFSWVGAGVPSTRGGRRAHPPKVLRKIKKINKKELKKALLSALTYVGSAEKIKQKYSSLKDNNIDVKFPIVVEDKILKLKTKQFFESLKKILGGFFSIAIQKKTIRAGKGKMRGRKYKKNAGVLIVIGKEEDKKIKGIDVKKADTLKLSDLASGGARLVIFTEKAIKDLEK